MLAAGMQSGRLAEEEENTRAQRSHSRRMVQRKTWEPLAPISESWSLVTLRCLAIHVPLEARWIARKMLLEDNYVIPVLTFARTQWPFLLLALFILRALKRRYLSSVSDVPALSFISTISRLGKVQEVLSGKTEKTQLEAHRKYGTPRMGSEAMEFTEKHN